MKILISPAKKMQEQTDLFEPGGLPGFLKETERLLECLKAMDEAELKLLFKASDRITRENFLRLRTMEPERAMSPALLSYVGIQYQYMAPHLFSGDQWEYVKKHLRILSGFYGMLKPDDRVVPYRLEMQAELSADGTGNLYEFWGDRLFCTLMEEEQAENGNRILLNLASREYSRAVEPYLTPECRFVTCVFGQESGGKVKMKATEAKMARGEMVRFMAERKVEDPEELRDFRALGYEYSEERSEPDTLVYLKKHR